MGRSLPHIHVLGTGGTIASLGVDRLDLLTYSETGKRLDIGQLLQRIPEAQTIARVTTEQFFELPSPALGPQEWLQLSKRITHLLSEDRELAGIVVTHGTATLEETAYFLHLTVKSDKPVVVTGAMRPPSALGTDTDVNLLRAIRVACSPAARGKGVLTILNEQVHSARDVTKMNTAHVDTFKPGELGFLGYADPDGEVIFYRSPTRRHTSAAEFDIAQLRDLPRVDIVSVYAGGDGLLVEALTQHGVKGIVIASAGGGSLTPGIEKAAADAVRSGAAVVISSRAGSGRVFQRPKFQRNSFIAGDDLLPQKARVLLMLGLSVTSDREQLQRMFREY